MASAISGLTPLPYDPKEPAQILVGVGSYSGQQAFALGYNYYINNSKAINFGMALSGSEKMYRVGAAWKIGPGKLKNDAVGSDINLLHTVQQQQDQINQLRDQINQLKQLIEKNNPK